jgi:NAD(P)-dependent dehydrogenase (short-subunit alcohol dehydrogenase family)
VSEPRTIVVTGANTGIGKVTARELARSGDRVVLAGRSQEKLDAAVAEVRASTGSDALETLLVDLTDLASVQRAAAELRGRLGAIDVLVANAGVAGQRGQTAQGFELAFGTNHLGHFLFVTSLLDLVEAAGSTEGPARIVIVSSDSHYDAKGIAFDELQRSTPSMTGLPEYAVSKLANVAFSQELARRLGDHVWVGALHPGVIASDVWRRIPWPIRPIMTRFMASPDTGAETSLLLATSDEVLSHRGEYWSVLQLKDPSPVATPELAADLWARSERWTADFRS